MHPCTVELDPRAGIKYGMSRARVCKTGASKNERIFLLVSYDAWIFSLIFFFLFFGGGGCEQFPGPAAYN